MQALVEVWRLFLMGGHVMWLLLGCSLLAITVGIQRITFLRTVIPTEQEEMKITHLLRNKFWKEAYDNAQASSSGLGDVLCQALVIEDAGERDISYQGDATIMMYRMYEGMRYLDTIVTLSPLLGLLGTVLGMIRSFNVLSVEAGNMGAITGGVGEALIATATGLGVAVIALGFHSYLTYRLDKAVTTLEEWGNLIKHSKERSL